MQSVPEDYPTEMLWFIILKLIGTYIVGYLLPGDSSAPFLCSHDAFASVGYGFGNMEALTAVNFNWLVIPVMSVVTACFRQGFYAYRIFVKVPNNPDLRDLCSSMSSFKFFMRIEDIYLQESLTSTVAAMITGVHCFQVGDLSKLRNRRTPIVFELMRSRLGFHRTRNLVSKIIGLTIETGSVTAVIALLGLILYFGFPDRNFHEAPALIMPKLYANTIYMVLNSRIKIKGGRGTYMSTDMEITTTMMRDITSHSTQGPQRTVGMQGNVLGVASTKELMRSDHETDRMSRCNQCRRQFVSDDLMWTRCNNQIDMESRFDVHGAVIRPSSHSEKCIFIVHMNNKTVPKLDEMEQKSIILTYCVMVAPPTQKTCTICANHGDSDSSFELSHKFWGEICCGQEGGKVQTNLLAYFMKN
ncbi:hypothetical protein IW261DRAFT_1416289 [Armillaria novae-zelandiae]|uniref:DUF6534 domain-containing protein n=1 Tax=Armillaria novae-zelandiae TaxID=153914 RepID=A0AA39UKE3_9AGAR|nr:hypothetical protein IW261DRAFT_1416289 [Armillaria novae-zelandiae]